MTTFTATNARKQFFSLIDNVAEYIVDGLKTPDTESGW